jgi:GDP-D-mannose 3',5'-epimerase
MIVVCGAGGFIGGHLVRKLLARGDRVRAVDVKPFSHWYQLFPEAENLQFDLSLREDCMNALLGAREVYNLAADMGGMGFIANNKALCMLNVLINTHLLMAAQVHDISRYFFASSACVYPVSKQKAHDGLVSLKESDAYPAEPEDGYGWEKLFSERMCKNFGDDFGMTTRIARFHNVYGPHGSFIGGREKAPAAICRKVIEAQLHGTNSIDIWGDGSQLRSFTFIDDCLHGIDLIMKSDVDEPLNLGSDEAVTINQLTDLVESIAGTKLQRQYTTGAPTGVAARNSDNERIRAQFGWAPSTPLTSGLERTYRWIYDNMRAGVAVV